MRRDAGKRDRWITIQAGTEGDDGSGFPVFTWTDLAGMWAIRRQQSGTEAYTAHLESPAAVIEFETVYRGDCDPELVNVPKWRRIVYQGIVHDIQSADVVGRREGLLFSTLSAFRLEGATV